jgi:Calcineurin-like phosphoesterase
MKRLSLFVLLSQLVLVLVTSSLGQTKRVPATGSWKFAVSGDSRNCGDVVMPSIARMVREEGAAFYWHLGDYRAIYDFDQDYKARKPNTTIVQYEVGAWPDFIQRQLGPFGDLPLYLALGNHETIPPKTRSEAIPQFADWLDTAELRTQRLGDNPSDHLVKFYYHWIRGGVDFITLDNASEDQFDDAQLGWFAAQLGRDSKNREIRSVVVGMHEALPESISAGHSMNETAQGTESGRKAYQGLVEFRKETHKNVYLLASHSHFFMDNVYNTACRRNHPDEVLPGWIVGTAGAVRYRLPADVSGSMQHLTDVYGYLLATVSAEGTLRFEFKQINESDVTESTRKDYKDDFIHSCFAGNSSTYVPAGPACPAK